MYCAAFVPPDAIMRGIAGSRLASEPRPRPDAMCYPEPSASTVYAFLAVQMHYQMQMQMHDRLAKGGYLNRVPPVGLEPTLGPF